MSGVELIKVEDADDDMRLDRWFRQYYPQIRHGQLEKMLRKGQIRIEGGRVKANRRIKTGEIIRVPPIMPAKPERPKPENHINADDQRLIRESVIYEDDFVMAINKPFGLAVQGGAKTPRHIDGMLDALTPKGAERPRLVHRLDRDTGGLLLLGRTRKAAALLSEAFQKHHVEKEYWALVRYTPKPYQGTITLPIAKRMIRINTSEQERMVVAAQGESVKDAYTDYQLVEEAGGKASFVALRPRTGRTHQLRVHCTAIGTPIIGDGKYGGELARLEGVSPKMHLFCRAMRFPHPTKGKEFFLKADLTGHMLKSWNFFSFDKNAELQWPE
ncbi:MAG: RluA family pseudouridine synthase [bacterium]